jgi:hypothetical protein
MTCDEFITRYWSQYLSIEKEFAATIHYLALDVNNENAYSQAYSKLMLEIGSETDVVFKEYCSLIDSTFSKKYRTIGRYKDSIKKSNPDFITQEVEIINYNRNLSPWEEWNTLPDAPWWWTAYNKVKHSRTSIVEIDGLKQEGYKFANQKYILLALAGLYQIMVNYYRRLASDEKKQIVTPMPGSRVFKMTGGEWDSISFYGDSAFYINEGNLVWEMSTIHY